MSPIEIVLCVLLGMALLFAIVGTLVIGKMINHVKNVESRRDSIEEAYDRLKSDHTALVDAHQDLQSSHYILERQRDDAYKNLTMILNSVDEPEEDVTDVESNGFAKFSNAMQNLTNVNRPTPVDTPLDSEVLKGISELYDHGTNENSLKTHFSIDLDGTITDNTEGDVLVVPEDHDEKEEIHDQEGS